MPCVLYYICLAKPWHLSMTFSELWVHCASAACLYTLKGAAQELSRALCTVETVDIIGRFGRAV